MTTDKVKEMFDLLSGKKDTWYAVGTVGGRYAFVFFGVTVEGRGLPVLFVFTEEYS